MRPIKKGILACGVAVTAVAVVSCTGESEGWDGIVELGYNGEALVKRVKRRIGLVTSGVALRDNLAADSVWTNVMGHTFIARSRSDGETGIVSRRAKTMGIQVRGEGRGITRIRFGQYAIHDGFHIVDVFSPHRRYLTSVVAPTSMHGRQILQHTGVVKRHSDVVDRLFMDPEEVVHWRELFHIVVRNRGFGTLYVRNEGSKDSSSESDSLRVLAERYELQEVGDYVLVGKNRSTQSYRHIFSVGGKYIMSVIQYGGPRQTGQALLAGLGLIDQERAGTAGIQSGSPSSPTADAAAEKAQHP